MNISLYVELLEAEVLRLRATPKVKGASQYFEPTTPIEKDLVDQTFNPPRNLISDIPE